MADPATENQTEQEERPSWLPENFKSPEDLATSYKEAQRKISEQGERMSEMERELASLTELAAQLQQAPQWQQPQSQDPAERLYAQYAEAVESGDYRTQLAVQAQISQLAAQAVFQGAQQQQAPQWQQVQESQSELIATQATNALRSTYQDWNEY